MLSEKEKLKSNQFEVITNYPIKDYWYFKLKIINALQNKEIKKCCFLLIYF
jgi:hypothetical protein